MRGGRHLQGARRQLKEAMATCGFCVEGPIYYMSAMLQGLELQTRVTHQLLPWQDHVAGGMAHCFTVKERKSSELWEVLETGKGIQYLTGSQLPHCAPQNPKVPL